MLNNERSDCADKRGDTDFSKPKKPHTTRESPMDLPALFSSRAVSTSESDLWSDVEAYCCRYCMTTSCYCSVQSAECFPLEHQRTGRGESPHHAPVILYPCLMGYLPLKNASTSSSVETCLHTSSGDNACSRCTLKVRFRNIKTVIPSKERSLFWKNNH